MKHAQIRRKRPTLKEAHAFFKDGFQIDPQEHYLSGEGRELELQSTIEELSIVVRKYFPRTNILEYAVLKAHLIVERALFQYIRGYSTVFIDPNKSMFGFQQKVEIAYILGFGANHYSMLPTVEMLNQVRNEVAHKFTIDRTRVDELLRINHADYNDLIIDSDQQRIKMLKALCGLICGYVCGIMEAQYYMAVRDEEEIRANRGKASKRS